MSGADGQQGATDPEALRVRAAGALERALAFVDARGDALAHLRARALLEQCDPVEVVEAVSSRQVPDGSFVSLGLARQGAFGLAEIQGRAPVPLLGTAEALCILRDHSGMTGACVERAAAFLSDIQADDGAWGDASLAPDVRVYLTGMLAGLLGATRFVRPRVHEAAADYMEAHWTPKAVVEGGWGALLAYTLYFVTAPGERADAASVSWCGREIERSFRVGRFGALATARILMYGDVAAIPGADLGPAELLAPLLAEQGADGGFAIAVGTGSAVSPTLDAMRALLRLCGAL